MHQDYNFSVLYGRLYHN